MPRIVELLHWALLGLCLATSVALAVRVMRLLTRSFEAGALTREVLSEALGLAFVLLAAMFVAGWAFATRPRAPPRAEYDTSIFA